MKISRILLTVALTGMAALGLQAQENATLKWLQTSHDFGAFDEDMGKVSCTFLMVNTGTEPIAVLSARANCGCTIPSYTKEPVQPGDTAKIVVTYDPAGRPGKFNKKIRVETNGIPGRSTLAIQGTVIGAMSTLKSRFPIEAGALKLRNTTVPFGEVLKGRTKTAFLDGYNQSADTIHPVLAKLPAHIKADIAPKAVPPGEQVTFTFFYNSSLNDEWGVVTDSAIVSGAAEGMPVKPIQLIAVVNEDFSKLSDEQREKAPRIAVSETLLQFVDEASRDEEKSITITNHGKEPLLIRRIQCLDPDITASINKDKVKSGQSATVKVRYKSLDPSEAHPRAAKLNIITNDPDRPQQVVRIAIQP